MIFRQIDENGDWNFGRGINDFATQNRAIGLNIQTRIRSWVNDCFFDQDAGIDWINRLGSKGQRDILELDLRNIILQSEGVTGIIEFSTSVVDRNFTANYSVETTFSKSYTDTVEVNI